MSPTTRKVARLIGELSSIERRLKNLLPEIKDIEFQAQALQNAKQITQPQSPKARWPGRWSQANLNLYHLPLVNKIAKFF